MTLLSKAKKITVRRKGRPRLSVSRDEFNLIMAWLGDDIRQQAAADAVGLTPQGFNSWAGGRLMSAVRQGWLVRIPRKNGRSEQMRKQRGVA